MANYNRVLLIGNMTRDPELKYTPSGTAVAEFGLAMNRRWTGRDGASNEETTFVDCEVWARQAEVLNQYGGKGRALFVEGRLKLDQWETQEGQKRSKLRVVCENFQFLGRRGEDDMGGGGSQSEAPRGPAQAPAPPRDDHQEPGPGGGGDDDDDIPF